jgi:hypothetical protein
MMHDSWFSPPKPLKQTFPYNLQIPLPNTCDLELVTVKEISDTLKSCSNTSTPGTSGIGYKILKWALTAAPDEFMAIIQASIKLGIHHDLWKSTTVVVIPKAKKPSYTDPKTWRPIQLLDCLGKIVEKIVARRIIYKLGRYQLSALEQFGGRSNSSCYDAVATVLHDIQMAKKQKLVSSLLMVDIKGFFDHVHHDRMIKILYDKGFPLAVCKWVKSFVTNRSASIKLDDYISDFLPTFIGVPQGSPVSPVLACLYADEPLAKMIKDPIFTFCKIPIGIRAYVDDFGLLAISKTLKDNTETLKLALRILLSYLDEIGLRIDPKKSELMQFSWRRTQKGVDPLPSIQTIIYNLPTTISPPLKGII